MLPAGRALLKVLHKTHHNTTAILLQLHSFHYTFTVVQFIRLYIEITSIMSLENDSVLKSYCLIYLCEIYSVDD